MFSGIIEKLGVVKSIEYKGSNLVMGIQSAIANELKIDQSVAHNGVCLTVVDIKEDIHFVDVIQESLEKSNLADLKKGDHINLERSVRLNDRLDGHIVQGHVDQTAECMAIRDLNGSWQYRFKFREKPKHVLIDKGSISINGVSLTISDLSENEFEVSIIPYTYANTVFNEIQIGSRVNIEFDIVGKYIEKLSKS
ncbi:MAG: riboflavin synthase [Vicingaceae bacterium]